MLDSLTSMRIDIFRLPNWEATVVSNYREMHYVELLNDSQKQENIEELKNWSISEDRRININSFDSYFWNIND